jgi:hypothetical protein
VDAKIKCGRAFLKIVRQCAVAQSVASRRAMAFPVAKKTAYFDAHNLAAQIEFLLFDLLKV